MKAKKPFKPYSSSFFAIIMTISLGFGINILTGIQFTDLYILSLISITVCCYLIIKCYHLVGSAENDIKYIISTSKQSTPEEIRQTENTEYNGIKKRLNWHLTPFIILFFISASLFIVAEYKRSNLEFNLLTSSKIENNKMKKTMNKLTDQNNEELVITHELLDKFNKSLNLSNKILSEINYIEGSIKEVGIQTKKTNPVPKKD